MDIVRIINTLSHLAKKTVVGILVLVSITPFNIFSADPQRPVRPGKSTRRPANVVAADTVPILTSDSIASGDMSRLPVCIAGDSIHHIADTDSLISASVIPEPMAVDSSVDLLFDDGVVADTLQATEKKMFVPDPTKAVWYSALCPGLGQIYNRRYWKLPIVIGGFMGLGYGASWNNSMLSDYTRAYYDLMDNDPSTKSYMDFFPPTTSEESLNRTWLERILKSRKDYFRRNRDLCIIGMIGVYLIAVVDAYVDASLTNFDISPDLSMQLVPTLLYDQNSPYPAIGVQWALNF